MHIYPKYTGPIRPDSTRTSETADAPESTPVRPLTPATGNPAAQDRSDKVEISDAGRALAARDRSNADGASGLDPARAARIRGRILSGAYDTLEVVDAVARRLLDSGDL